MRTKTLALSAMLGLLGSASVMAQNVYSVNAVGYINVTLYPGWNIVTCPLICSPDNTLNTVLNNGLPNAPYGNANVYQFRNGSYGAAEFGNPGSASGGWAGGGADISLNPGSAIWFQNPNAVGSGINMTATFVGSVPTTASNPTVMKQVLIPGYNLVGSVVPITGDLVTSAVTALTFAASGDYIYFFDPLSVGPNQIGYEPQNQFAGSAGWSGSGPNAAGNGDPLSTSVTEGFWYNNSTAANETWTEVFSIN
jgi:hypothetical protein